MFGMFSGKEENEQSEKSKNLYTILSRVIFTLIIIFAITSVYTILWGYIGVLPSLPGTDIDAMWIYYSIFSFSISIVISVYYLSLTVIQKK
jgi:hypothetical protein